jgi:hypothetical protein
MNGQFGNPVKLDMSHPLCKTLNAILSTKKNYRYRDCEPLAEYETQFVLTLSPKIRKEVGHHLTPTRVREVNTIIKGYFYDRMFDHFDMMLFKNPNYVIKDGALQYLLHKNVPLDQVQLETVLKAYRRHRKKSPTSFIKTDWSRRNTTNSHDLSPNSKAS